MKSCWLLPCKVLYFDPQQQNLKGDQHRQCFAVDSIAPQMHHGNHNLREHAAKGEQPEKISDNILLRTLFEAPTTPMILGEEAPGSLQQ